MSTAKAYIDNLTAHGEFAFTIRQFSDALSVTYEAAFNALARLKRKKEIISPNKGYYLILSPEFRKQSCLPADYFIDDLMAHLNKRYYVALLSAALYHGAAHQQPQAFQVMVRDKKRPIHCGNVSIEFTKNLYCTQTPIQRIKTRTGYMNVSTPEATAMDMLKYLRQSGGINRVATVLDELAESMSPDALSELAAQSKKCFWIYRLGFLLDRQGRHNLAQVLYESVHKKPVGIIPLAPYTTITGAPRNKKWHIAVNTKIESDIHDPN